MSNLVVTFGHVSGLGARSVNLESGGDARTEVLVIDGDRRETSISASNGLVTLYAEVDCWVAIGGEPNAEAASVGCNRRFMKEGWQRQFATRTGDLVSVVGA